MNKIAKNYIYNLIYNILVVIVPLITAPYLSRVLGANGTGQYSYVHSTTALITTVVMLGIYNYGNRQIAYVRDNKEELDHTFWRVMTSRVIISFFGTIIYVFVVLVIGRYEFLFLLYYTYLMGYFIDCTWLFVGVEDMKWAVLKNILIKVMCVVGIFVFVKNQEDIWKYVLIQGSSVLIGNLTAYSQIHKYVGKIKIITSGLTSVFKDSFILFLPSVASTIYLQCDKIMIELMTSRTDQVSFYDYSEKIVTIPLAFITVLSTVMMPRIANEFSKNNNAKISELINNAARFSLFLAAPLMVGIMVMAPKLIPWYLGDEFLPTITAIVIISPIIITNTLSGISGTQYFTATNQISIILKSQIIACVGNVAMNAMLIPNLGFVGAAIATIVSSFLVAGIQYINLIKQIKLPGILKEGLKYCLISAIMGIIVYLTTKQMTCTPVTNIVQILIGVTVYMLILIINKDAQLLKILHIINSKLKRKSGDR